MKLTKPICNLWKILEWEKVDQVLIAGVWPLRKNKPDRPFDARCYLSSRWFVDDGGGGRTLLSACWSRYTSRGERVVVGAGLEKTGTALTRTRTLVEAAWDDEHEITTLRKYYALWDEAENVVVESKRIWLDTPFSLFALQSTRVSFLFFIVIY